MTEWASVEITIVAPRWRASSPFTALLGKGVAGSVLRWRVNDRLYETVKDDEKFRPERWLDGSTKDLPKFAYFPFGGGPRVCIGNSFAQMEAVLLLATIAQRFRLSLVPSQRITPTPYITLRPEPGIRMLLARR